MRATRFACYIISCVPAGALTKDLKSEETLDKVTGSVVKYDLAGRKSAGAGSWAKKVLDTGQKK
ncbi:hypothetical protein [Neomoorella mulderi]|uniref:hypothetical protein n=1 Tax=Neomoorella mulderi TaxID=202604 RepID=UPI0007821224|nr:hypothetical protein [Moorella mulderi]